MLLGGLFEGPAPTQSSILSTYIRSITLFHLYRYDIIWRLRKNSAVSVCLFKFLANLDKTTVYYWILTHMLQTESQKLFISSLLHGESISQGGCQSFLLFFQWSRKMAFRDATPETGCTQSHCLINLSIQLTLLYHWGRGSNQFNMMASGRWLHSGCRPHTNTPNTGLDTWDTVHWQISPPTLQCYSSLLCYFRDEVSHNPPHSVRHLVNV